MNCFARVRSLCAVAVALAVLGIAQQASAQYVLPVLGTDPVDVIEASATAYGTVLATAMGVFAVVLIAWRGVRSLRRSLS
jgi:hypothetical protein